jgi:hypothetical protein
MELKFTELDTMNSNDKFNYELYEKQNAVNYWEKPVNVQEKPQKKKKISFNDILSNMNLVVNKEGVLQFMTVNKEHNIFGEQKNNNYNTQNNNYNTQNNNYNTQNNNYNTQNNINNNIKKILPQNNNINNNNNNNNNELEPALKHSYIYNKYFKDYGDPNAGKPAPRVPKTMEEYRRMLLEDKIKAIQHKKMVEEVKSKKMMFTSAPGSITNPRNIKPSVNTLRTMNFR